MTERNEFEGGQGTHPLSSSNNTTESNSGRREIHPKSIFEAAESGLLEEVKRFLEQGTDINCRNESGRSPLHIASKMGHLDVVEFLVTQNADVKLKSYESCYTPLHSASENGHLAVVEFLVEKGKADVHAKAKNGDSPIVLAEKNGKLEVVEFLAKKVKGDLFKHLFFYYSKRECLDIVRLLFTNEKADLQFPLLCTAAEKGHMNAVKFLVNEAKTKVNLKNEKGFTPLHIASLNKQLEVVQFLVNKAKLDLTVKNKKGFTPLHIASQNGHREIIEFLVKANADVNLTADENITPLYIASEKGHLKVVKFLVQQAEASVNVKTKKNWSNLHIAARNGHLNVIKFFIEENSNHSIINEETDQGRTALHIASEHGHLTVVKYLVKNPKANVDVADKLKWTPLFLASQNGHIDVVRFWIKAKGAVTAVTEEGSTALHIASFWGHLNVVKILAKKDVINVRDNQGSGPLYVASKRGHLDVVKLLIKRGANVNMENNQRFTPLYIASEQGRLEVVNFLVTEAEADVNIKTCEDLTPLQKAIKSGKFDIACFLLKRKEVCKDAARLLFLACDEDDDHLIDFLLKNSNFKDELFLSKRYQSDHTILMAAALGSKIKVLMYLVGFLMNEKEVRLTSKLGEILHHNINGKTILSILIAQGQAWKICCDIIFSLEIKVHKTIEEFSECLKSNVAPCPITMQAIQAAEKRYKNDKKKEEEEKIWIFIKQFCIVAFPIVVSILDLWTDCSLIFQARDIFSGKTNSTDCISTLNCYNETRSRNTDQLLQSTTVDIEWQLAFLIFFVLFPLVSYAVQWYHSETIGLKGRRLIQQEKSKEASSTSNTTPPSDPITPENDATGASTSNTTPPSDPITSDNDTTRASSSSIPPQNAETGASTTLPNVPITPENASNGDSTSNTIQQNDTTTRLIPKTTPENAAIGGSTSHRTTLTTRWGKFRVQYLQLEWSIWWLVQLLVVPLWPFVCMIPRLASSIDYSYASNEAKNDMFEKKKKETQESIKAIMAEVCMESSFQPLLQLYLFLPCLISQVQSSRNLSFGELQFWSVITSVIAIAWSFSSYTISKTWGAIPLLSFGFIIIFLQCLCQISGRMILITFLSYALNGFWVGFVVLILHIAILLLVQFSIHGLSQNFGTVLLNSLANMHLQIYVVDNFQTTKQNDNLRQSKEPTKNRDYLAAMKGLFKLQPTFWVEGLILFENIFILAVVTVMMNDNAVALGFAWGGFGFYCFGYLLKWIYLKKIHIWRFTHNLKQLEKIGRPKKEMRVSYSHRSEEP